MAGFEPLRTQHTVALTTFRRDGTAVVTPVSLVVDDQDVGTAVMRDVAHSREGQSGFATTQRGTSSL